MALSLTCIQNVSAQTKNPGRSVGGFKARVALVIGNSEYKRGALENPVNDATDISAALAKHGFEVVKVLDADKKKMREAIRQFGEMLGPQSVAMFFYAGHGVQVNGRNFLIPTDAEIKSAEDVEDQGLSLDWAMQSIDARKPRFNIVILDACRNNPFARSYGTGGLAAVDAAAGSLIAFSTSPTKVASDGSGRNGLYTHHLLQHISTPDLKIEEIFKRVRIGVMEQSAGVQVPWENTSLTADLVLNAQNQALTQPATPIAVADTTWTASADLGGLRSYLNSHPVEKERDQVVLAFARANASKALRKEALKLSGKDCDKCPRLTAMDPEKNSAQLYVGTDLITVEEYQYCVADGACRQVMPRDFNTKLAAFMPANNVSFNDASGYIAWLNKKSSKKKYRLPRQDEWMKVFKSGYFLASGKALAANKSLCEIGNFYDISGAVLSSFPWAPNTCNDGFPDASPVGVFLPSLDGVFDLVGNLWQWTSSCQDSEAAPTGGQCKKARLVGGSWATAPRWNWQSPPEIAAEADQPTDIFGFRVVATE